MWNRKSEFVTEGGDQPFMMESDELLGLGALWDLILSVQGRFGTSADDQTNRHSKSTESSFQAFYANSHMFHEHT